VNTNRFYRRWRNRVTTLRDQLRALLRDCHRQGQVEQIHQLRVVLRRFRLYLRLGRPFLRKSDYARFRLWARQLAQATGPLRDLDVALEWLHRRAPAVPAVTLLQARRLRLWRRLDQAAHFHPPSFLHALTPKPTRRKDQPLLAKRYARFMDRFRHIVVFEAANFFELDLEARHQFRRTLRQWRYLRELGLPRRSLTRDPLVQKLLRGQQAIGEHQNLALCADLLSRLRPTPELGQLQQDLAAEMDAWLARTRRGLAPLSRIRG
jgi:CHAD domain-containing protein